MPDLSSASMAEQALKDEILKWCQDKAYEYREVGFIQELRR